MKTSGIEFSKEMSYDPTRKEPVKEESRVRVGELPDSKNSRRSALKRIMDKI